MTDLQYLAFVVGVVCISVVSVLVYLWLITAAAP